MAERKVVPFDEFYYQLKLMHLFQKHPVHICNLIIFHLNSTLLGTILVKKKKKIKIKILCYMYVCVCLFPAVLP
jgi:hypothetical protein